MNSTKGAHELQKENLRDEQGGWRDRISDDLPMLHATAALLWSTTGRIYKLQTLRSEHEDPGESETLQRVVWRMPSGVQGQAHECR